MKVPLTIFLWFFLTTLAGPAALALPKAEADYNTAMALISKGSHKRAIPYLDRAIKLSPADWKLYDARGSAWLDLEDYKRALADLTKAVELAHRSQIYEDRARCYFEMHNFKDAIADQSEAIKRTENPELRTQRVRVRSKYYLEKGDSKNALADLGDLIAQRSKDSRLYFDRADMYHQLKQYQNAVADYTRGLRLAGSALKNADYWYEQRARQYDKLGKKDLAEADRIRASRSVNKNEALELFKPKAKKFMMQ
jgi:tetratricopeptide (TPR) repeat protein